MNYEINYNYNDFVQNQEHFEFKEVGIYIYFSDFF